MTDMNTTGRAAVSVGPIELAKVAQLCDGATEESETQWESRCPAHDDRKPSLRLTIGDLGLVRGHCQAGCDWAAVRAALVAREAPEAWLGRAGMGGRSTRAAVPRQRVARKVAPLPTNEEVAAWCRRLAKGPATQTQRRFLIRQRGFTGRTILRAGIGWRQGRYTIPVRDADGNLINVRRYRTDATNKFLNWPGHGARTLYPLNLLSGDSLVEPLLLCEGELDALLARQYGFAAISGTGGASNPPEDLSSLAGRRLYVVYDCDDKGRQGAARIADRLVGTAAEVRVVDLELPEKGNDLTDWFVTYGKSAEDLRLLLAEARPYTRQAVAVARRLSVVRLSDVTERRVEWLWPGRLPFGKLTILEGDPGLGKSTVWCDWVGRVTTGRGFPGSAGSRQPVNVLLIAGEDDLEDTIKPRLRAAGANMDRVLSVALPTDDEGNVLPITIPEELHEIERLIDEESIQLVVFDPITAYLSETISSNNDASVRRALTPLGDVAQRTHAAVLLVRHLNKSGDMKALYRGGGSIAFIGAARVGMIVAPHPEEPGTVVLAINKNNLACNDKPSITYRVESWDEDVTVSVISWGDELDLTADDVLGKRDGRKASPERDEAVLFLREVLHDGPLPADQVREKADGAGVTWSTIKRAKEEAGVITEAVRDKKGRPERWEWRLAPQVIQIPGGAL